MKDLYVPRATKKSAWRKKTISPGAVGSVGDVLTSVRLKQSCSELRPRYDKMGRGKKQYMYGSAISDGAQRSKISKGLGADVVDREPYSKNLKEFVGYFHQDIVPVDRSSMTQLLNQGNFGWKSKVAEVYRAKVTGQSFLPLPGGYGPREGDQPRGSAKPEIVSSSSGTGYPSKATNPRVDFKLDPRVDFDPLLDQPYTFMGRTPTRELNMMLGRSLFNNFGKERKRVEVPMMN